ncbi:Ras- protein Rab-26 [Balamuthia mandrillaris]
MGNCAGKAGTSDDRVEVVSPPPSAASSTSAGSAVTHASSERKRAERKKGKAHAPVYEDSEDFDAQFNVLLIGDSGIGKTSLLLRFTTGEFVSVSPTTNVDQKTRILHVDGKRIRLVLWDTVGQERFRTLSGSFYRKTDAFALMYDITSKEHLNNAIQSWEEEMRRFCPNVPVRVFVGNKVDLEESRQVVKTDAASEAERLNIPHFELSAKASDGYTIDQPFIALVKELMKKEATAKNK